MENTCPTVQIAADNEQGFVVINESDFDPDTQTIFGSEAKDEKVAMSKAELQAALDEKGIAHKPAMSKAELQSMLDDAQ